MKSRSGFTLIEVLTVIAIVGILVAMTVGGLQGCDASTGNPTTAAGNVGKKTVAVATDASGWTVEQRNIANRLKQDNAPGSIKHLYVISAMSGDVLLYSSVQGKVTSSSKRLTPNTVAAMEGQYVGGEHNGMAVNMGGYTKRTSEVLQDDGSYGSSIPYLFWWDEGGMYHQHYVSGGQILHISDQPIRVPKIVINLSGATEEIQTGD